jgi:predicted nucleic acid-binding protein
LTQRVLVDTSVWVKVFRKAPGITDDALRLFRAGLAVVHPWTIDELVLGGGVPPHYLRALHGSPQVPRRDDEEVMAFLLEWRLQRVGIGLVDLQLLSTAHRHALALWTTDGSLTRAAATVGLPPIRPEDWPSAS